MNVDLPELTPDQVIGREFLISHPKAILGDDVGFGKTAILLSAIRLLDLRKVLWITGAQASYQVAYETGRFAPGFSSRVVRGPKSARMKFYSTRADISVLGYETFRSDASSLSKIHWDVVILDDASKFKNPVSGLSKAAVMVTQNSPRAWAATATPVETSLMDLWSIFHAISFYPAGDYETFSSRHLVFGYRNIGGRQDLQIVGYRDIETLQRSVAPYILRRQSTQGPSLTVVDVTLGLTPEQFFLYKNARAGFYGSTIHDRFTRSLMFCDSTIFADPNNPKSSKLDYALAMLKAHSGKVVVYSMWKKVLQHFRSMLLAENISWVEISGDISIPERTKNQRQFLEDPDLKVCLLTRAGEQALNLQSAQLMICLNRIANPKRMYQVHGRIKRMSSEFEKVFVVNLVIGGSVEQRMLELSNKRQQLSDDFFGDISPLRLSEDDMRKLLAVEEGDLVSQRPQENISTITLGPEVTEIG